MAKFADKGRILKVSREKQLVTYKIPWDKWIQNTTTENLGATDKTVLKEKLVAIHVCLKKQETFKLTV